MATLNTGPAVRFFQKIPDVASSRGSFEELGSCATLPRLSWTPRTLGETLTGTD